MTLVSLTRCTIVGSILFVNAVEVALGGCSASKCVEADQVAEIDRTRSLIKEPQPMEIVAPLDLLGGHEYLCILIRFRIEADGTAVAAETLRAEPHPLLLRSALYSLYGTRFSVPEDDEDRWGLLLFEFHASDLKDSTNRTPTMNDDKINRTPTENQPDTHH